MCSTPKQNFLLGDLDISAMDQDWGEPQANRSVENRVLSIGGKKFANGLGTHAVSRFVLDLSGQGDRFTAEVGVDDEVGAGRGCVQFEIAGDEQMLWQSRVLRGGDAAQRVDVSIKYVKKLALLVKSVGDSIDFAHADWADAKITMLAGQPIAAPRYNEPAIILTPKSSPKPRINNAKVFGVRPGTPFLLTIAATGERPMKFSAANLPEGLRLDANTGQITGVITERGEHVVTLRAENALASAESKVKITCASKIGLTPVMGWNSWNCFASEVSAEKVKAAVDALVESGLINHGWNYINIDDYWQPHRNSNDSTLSGPSRSTEGKIIPNARFSRIKELTDYVHGKGLKIGVYSSPGPWTCGGCAGSYNFETQDAQTYGEWGFDYLKYDWCSYGEIEKRDNTGGSRDAMQKPYRIMRAALDGVTRSIIFSLCQYGMDKVWEWGAQIGGNSWRTTGDITDTWSSVSRIGFSQAGHEAFSGAGHFNDLDMLVVGVVGWGERLRPTRLTPNEQYSHISLWCLLNSPLLIGCDLTRLDEFTFSLLSNDEVLEVNQDPLCCQASRILQNGDLEIWAKDMEDGSKVAGLFDRGEIALEVSLCSSDLGLRGSQKVRDLWRQKDIGEFSDRFSFAVPRHGVMLVRIWPSQEP